MDTRASLILLYLNHEYKKIQNFHHKEKKNPELQTYFCCITLTLLVFSLRLVANVIHYFHLFVAGKTKKEKRRSCIYCILSKSLL